MGNMNEPVVRSAGLVRRHARKERLWSASALAAVLVICAACQRDEAASSPLPRLVRTVTVEAPRASADVNFLGHIEARDQASLSFRISGRLAERLVGIGATVKDGE